MKSPWTMGTKEIFGVPVVLCTGWLASCSSVAAPHRTAGSAMHKILHKPRCTRARRNPVEAEIKIKLKRRAACIELVASARFQCSRMTFRDTIFKKSRWTRYQFLRYKRDAKGERAPSTLRMHRVVHVVEWYT